jgi:inosose dehydratase
MEMRSSRREFIAALSTAAASLTLPGWLSALPANHSGIRFGYTAMTWGKAERQAIEDISAAGFQGIQFRSNALKEFQPGRASRLAAAAQSLPDLPSYANG